MRHTRSRLLRESQTLVQRDSQSSFEMANRAERRARNDTERGRVEYSRFALLVSASSGTQRA